MSRAHRAVTVCYGNASAWAGKALSGEPIAAGRSRHGDHHRDILNSARHYRRAHPIASRPSGMTFGVRRE